ncbi:unnamed protein product [Dracunculus medinensis]|uniref:WDR59/RTC1-like RING zinc finger domain-containing protein n=1 Tax=Dracunculus medinensis TaxID=318479 RepID=A0A3P7PD56_DRAME|nr:unnamed protein product [Dracunculus medinensis]
MNEICQQYADLLFRWCMYSKAAEILKYNENAPVAYPFFLRKYCASCEEKFDEGYCNKCFEKLSPFLCGICQGRSSSCTFLLLDYFLCLKSKLISGLIFVCEYCHHGGHIEHILEWFKQNTYCPTGCGCECIVVYL